MQLNETIVNAAAPFSHPHPPLHNNSSPFLRKRLSDVSISREHVRVEALPASGGSNGDGDGDGEDATAASARVTVLGSNPVVLIRRQVHL